ncbi:MULTISPECIES: hypothetical protein [Methylobacteriaceae]|uniref:hypothetical protein n=1 Tax=Methylobacteriaceae TaxID=119045 RepID=UPI000CDB013B|nr:MULTISPECIES: hypothetical protein [Methylobacteriaceae]MCP1549367.1 hypothetical protein [Methylorubrum zatmanii]MCP1554020.1 hypothetical protein [Methylorubrum extorquens]MCP1579669.1 hypothetical protein [Methylorubrum extorquens]POR41025.1 hypothetical protein CRT23_20525 [Methylobacterium sp. V23]
MTRTETNAAIAEQTASDARPDHVRTLVHALRIGGEDFAIEALGDMHDVSSDAEREALLDRARAIADGMAPIDPVTPGSLPLQEIAEILGPPATYWTVRAWTMTGCPHEGYGSALRCDPAALAAWCEGKAAATEQEPGAARLRTFAQRLDAAVP